jgi:hypothetical protein
MNSKTVINMPDTLSITVAIVLTACTQRPAEFLHLPEGPRQLPDPEAHQLHLPEVQELPAPVHLPGGKCNAHALFNVSNTDILTSFVPVPPDIISLQLCSIVVLRV